MSEFKMPSLGADMTTGTLVEWLVKPGDTVKRGDVIAEVETAKGLIEIEVWEDGTVQKILVEPVVEVPVGTVLALIGDGTEEGVAVPTAVPEAVAAEPCIEEAKPQVDHRPLTDKPVVHTNGKARTQRVKASPVAKRLAADLGVDLTQLSGSGPHGVINKADVEAAAAKAKAAKVEPPPTEQLAEVKKAKKAKRDKKAAKDKKADAGLAMRQAIANAMAKSNREIPHYYLENRIDMLAANRWLEEANAERSLKDRLLPAVLLIKATALALSKVPQLNGFWREDHFEQAESINIGFAIALRSGGLVTPAIFNADLKSLDELMVDMRDLIMRTRAGRLRSAELMEASIVLTNLGDLGVEKVFGVIYPPQVALVGLGKIVEQPWAVNGMLTVRPVLTATLAGDHRASDGRTGGQFLDELNKLLQNPAEWAL